MLRLWRCPQPSSPHSVAAGQAEEVGQLLIESGPHWPTADAPQASQWGVLSKGRPEYPTIIFTPGLSPHGPPGIHFRVMLPVKLKTCIRIKSSYKVTFRHLAEALKCNVST